MSSPAAWGTENPRPDVSGEERRCQVALRDGGRRCPNPALRDLGVCKDHLRKGARVGSL